MSLHIDGSNADKFHQYLPPARGHHKPKGLEKLAAGAKAFLNRLGYLVKHRSSIDEKKIINTIEQDPAAKDNPKVVKLYNAALQTMKYPINQQVSLFELAKKNAIAGKLVNLDDYGLNQKQKSVLMKDLAENHPDTLMAVSRQFGFSEVSGAIDFINKMQVAPKSEEASPKLETVAQAVRVETVKESTVADFGRALENVMRGKSIDDIPLSAVDRQALQIIHERGATIHDPSLRGTAFSSHNLNVANAAVVELRSRVITGTIADLEKKQELIRFALLKEEIDQSSDHYVRDEIVTGIGGWYISSDHGKEILAMIAQRMPNEYINIIDKYDFPEYNRQLIGKALTDTDRDELKKIAERKLSGP